MDDLACGQVDEWTCGQVAIERLTFLEGVTLLAGASVVSSSFFPGSCVLAPSFMQVEEAVEEELVGCCVHCEAFAWQLNGE